METKNGCFLQEIIHKVGTVLIFNYEPTSSVADPNPAFHFEANPDPTVFFNVDPDSDYLL
jgi:hypothetical protein